MCKDSFQHCRHPAPLLLRRRHAENGRVWLKTHLGLPGSRGLKSCTEPCITLLSQDRTGSLQGRFTSLSPRASPVLPHAPSQAAGTACPIPRSQHAAQSTNRPSKRARARRGVPLPTHRTAQFSTPLCRHRWHQNSSHLSRPACTESATHPSHPPRHSSAERRHPCRTHSFQEHGDL